MRYLGYTLAICLIFLIGGFISFIQYIHHIEVPANLSVNAIIVLTGEPNRIEKAFELLEKKTGDRVFISGAHRSVSKKVLRQKIPVEQNLAACCIDIGYEALDTAGNAKEASTWIKKHGYHTILIVTSSYHIPRILIELQRIDTTTKFIPYPVVSDIAQRNDLSLQVKMLKKILLEYLKILLLIVQIFLQNCIA
ncbi:MAG: YdcF family protein [Candidatus Liberibacter ctenarytainae]|uniref:YdcF family protein n=1 Tax=Candidatus Liberibacter ctenarytainae TaxID=2020335 RepID=A0A937AJJ9_9HYPH|nr:YdcF family protein [Candidatus Liberibacter ctenarytainae]